MIYYTDYNYSQLNPNNVTIVKKKKKNIAYSNYIFTFDIETTSTTTNGNKVGFMYIFMMSIDGVAVYGRNWGEFRHLLQLLKTALNLNADRKIIIYIHNLAYEFQFIYNEIEITDIFARETHKPLYAEVDNCFILKCSYMLSGYSLNNLAKNLKLPILKGEDFDYKKIRHSKTPLTENEKLYCENDVLIIHHYIKKEIERNGNITKIPLTKTGYVRNHYLTHTQKDKNGFLQLRQTIKKIYPKEDTFKLLQNAFQGGFTHANSKHVGNIYENVTSIDFNSSYPTQMIKHKYPMSEFTKINPNKDEFRKLLNSKACLFAVTFHNIKATTNTTILSSSKSFCKNAIIDNGRIYQADECLTYCTDVDFKEIENFYTFTEYEVHEMQIANYGYLPIQLIECVLDFYANKTTLKGVKGKEVEYMQGKEMLNSCYGMSVTSPLNDEIIFNNGEWNEIKPLDISDVLKHNYYDGYKQLLVYQWGVWVTAWARHELYTGVSVIGDDVLYCDTDSIKFINFEKHQKYIDEYNEKNNADIEKVLTERGINIERYKPKTIQGIKKPLGVWDNEGTYKFFKTLGAKRYCYCHKDNITDFNFTVAGVNKKNAVPYIMEQCEMLSISPFDFFTNGMEIPKKHTGKNEHTYIDTSYVFDVCDYMGVVDTVETNSSIHLTETPFTMSLSSQFLDFLYLHQNGKKKSNKLTKNERFLF